MNILVVLSVIGNTVCHRPIYCRENRLVLCVACFMDYHLNTISSQMVIFNQVEVNLENSN